MVMSAPSVCTRSWMPTARYCWASISARTRITRRNITPTAWLSRQAGTSLTSWSMTTRAVTRNWNVSRMVCWQRSAISTARPLPTAASRKLSNRLSAVSRARSCIRTGGLPVRTSPPRKHPAARTLSSSRPTRTNFTPLPS